ncbi:phototropic-responsive NPH3 family protein [Striga asiatica]|uniref:Phototropic-responsive NPH3 family protein n=1 Tax=Striga asiatica TaxID=4170 RepID=A0A5A7PXE9_STRAF|nr:phototropic-responsive NPH3 family protein [Striga asiatica]
MKFMKLGTRLDTFYTEEAIRTVLSDVPSDLTIRINGTTYLLHQPQYALLPKCGLLQRLVSSAEDSRSFVVDLHDIPGGDEAFELCAKFCYGITIELSANNFVPAFCAARFLRMTESSDNGNFVKKLETFFSSCILEGWKDSVVALWNTEGAYEWCENLGVVRKCIESIVDKISTPLAKVTWSYTYTRPGHEARRRSSAPKDWWTEDISLLGPDTFERVITTLTSSNTILPQLAGEALHVYACRHLLGPENENPSTSHTDPTKMNKKKKILEMTVNLIPAEKGSVSIKFLMRLLGLSRSNNGPKSRAAQEELVRLSARQLDEAGPDDFLLAGPDTEMVVSVLRAYMRRWRKRAAAAGGGAEREALFGSVRGVGKTVDRYLQCVAGDKELPVEKVVRVIESLPGPARPGHDELYKAIDIYLKEHPDLSKTDKRRLCGMLDCRKLSPEARAHAVRNERLPLRTVVQILFSEHEKGTSNKKRASREPTDKLRRKASAAADDLSKLHLSSENNRATRGENGTSEPGTSGGGAKSRIKEVGGPEIELRGESSKAYHQGKRFNEKAHNKR